VSVEAGALDRYDWRSGFGAAEAHEVPGIVRSWMPSGVRVLDVGCGPGDMTLRVNAGKENDVHGLEPDARRAAIARTKGLEVFTGYLDDAFIVDRGTFDVLTLLDVLEHTAEPQPLVQLARRALKPGGLLIASVPNVALWTVRARLLLGRFEYTETGVMDHTHLRWFTARSFRRLFEEASFVIEAQTVSAGTWLHEYRHLPLRDQIVPALAKLAPTLFGCQHIIKARPG
jgi:2-polyprenyl-3-methyl-5-hydroxy-6-metoxy-1,4-benzoquinol methylase